MGDKEVVGVEGGAIFFFVISICLAGSHDSQGLTRTHKDSQGFTRTHKVTITRSHKDSPGLARNHKDSQGLTRTHEDS